MGVFESLWHRAEHASEILTGHWALYYGFLRHDLCISVRCKVITLNLPRCLET
jgi:hypothetical protein